MIPPAPSRAKSHADLPFGNSSIAADDCKAAPALFEPDVFAFGSCIDRMDGLDEDAMLA